MSWYNDVSSINSLEEWAGIEFLHKSMAKFQQKWPKSLHTVKKMEFMEYFRRPDMLVTTYSATIKQWTKYLSYNGIYYSMDGLITQFINNLGAEFTTIRNKKNSLLNGKARTSISSRK